MWEDCYHALHYELWHHRGAARLEELCLGIFTNTTSRLGGQRRSCQCLPRSHLRWSRGLTVRLSANATGTDRYVAAIKTFRTLHFVLCKCSSHFYIRKKGSFRLEDDPSCCISHEGAGVSRAKRLKDFGSRKLESVLYVIILHSASTRQICSFKQSYSSQLAHD